MFHSFSFHVAVDVALFLVQNHFRSCVNLQNMPSAVGGVARAIAISTSCRKWKVMECTNTQAHIHRRKRREREIERVECVFDGNDVGY